MGGSFAMTLLLLLLIYCIVVIVVVVVILTFTSTLSEGRGWKEDQDLPSLNEAEEGPQRQGRRGKLAHQWSSPGNGNSWKNSTRAEQIAEKTEKERASKARNSARVKDETTEACGGECGVCVCFGKECGFTLTILEHHHRMILLTKEKWLGHLRKPLYGSWMITLY